MTDINVTHVFGDASFSSRSDVAHALLTTKNGDLLLLGSPLHSNYDGWTVNLAGARYKILADILLNGDIRELKISDDELIRTSATGSQRIHLFDAGVCGELVGETTLTFDCKKLYDESEHGRMYRIEKVENAQHSLNDLRVFTVHYQKYDGTSLNQNNLLYQFFICVATTTKTDILESWRNVEYSYDAHRGTHSTPWVFDAFRLNGNGIFAISVATSSKQAEHNAMDLLLRKARGKKTSHPDHHGLSNLSGETAHASVSSSSSHSHKPLSSALGFSPSAMVALRSLHSLHTRFGTYAGWPWFFQVWSRDELIASGGFLCAGEHAIVQSILDRWFSAIHIDGLMPAIYPDQGLESSDAPGWLAKRTLDFLQYCDVHHIDLSREMLSRWREGIERLLLRSQTKIRNGLVWTNHNTTWMDTAWNDDGREGACIEIQALTIAICDAYALLCEKTAFHGLVDAHSIASSIKKSVHDHFIVGNRLADHMRPNMVVSEYLRPNIFLAWHACPDLFTKDEWSMFFRSTIAHLWVSWGGLASIECTSPLFHEYATGEDIASYHRGDVWYYVNNLAAIALHAVAPDVFRSHILRIKEASERDLLSMGVVGHASEISSAAIQEPMGCHAQAWSAGTLVELLSALKEKNIHHR